MSVGKKLAILAPLAVLGLLAAIVFRKPVDEGDTEFGAEPTSPIVRRVTDASSLPPPAQIPHRLAIESDNSFRPPIAATHSSAVEVAVMPQIIERSVSPVGALLQPRESEASDTQRPGAGGDSHGSPELHAANDGTTGEEPRLHRVADGDTLSKLAVEYLGSAERYLEIFAANRDVLKRPDLLPIGVTLKIPPREKAAATGSGTASAPVTNSPAISAPSMSSPAASEAKLVPIPSEAWRPAQ